MSLKVLKIPFSRTNAIFIFKNYCKHSKFINIFEFLSVLILISYSNSVHKMHGKKYIFLYQFYNSFIFIV